MVLLWIIAGYTVAAALLYVAMRAKCKRNAVFRMPKNKWAFYVLSMTWGLPMVIVGAFAAIFLRLKGYKPTKYGLIWCFEIPNIDWGVWLGMFIIVPEGNESVKRHEHGHGIQNIYLGFFEPVVVALPSAIRFWYREIREKNGKPSKAAYDDVWFEKSATDSGGTFIERLKQKSIQKNS